MMEEHGLRDPRRARCSRRAYAIDALFPLLLLPWDYRGFVAIVAQLKVRAAS